jgi:hypothetical protein
VGVEAGEAFVPAGHRSFPGALVVSDREVDELTSRFVVGEVPADADGFANDAVEALDLVGIAYERRWMLAVPHDRFETECGVRVGEYGATVRDGGIWEQTQDGQAVVTRWAASPC